MATKRAGTKTNVGPPPVLTFHTEQQTKKAAAIVDALAAVLALVEDEDLSGTRAKIVQLVSALVNPAEKTVRYVDHTGQPHTETTFSSRVAARRRAAFTALREDGLSGDEIGALVGMTRTGAQAVFERGAGTRARQARVSLADAERLARAKAEDAGTLLGGPAAAAVAGQ